MDIPSYTLRSPSSDSKRMSQEGELPTDKNTLNEIIEFFKYGVTLDSSEDTSQNKILGKFSDLSELFFNVSDAQEALQDGNKVLTVKFLKGMLTLQEIKLHDNEFEFRGTFNDVKFDTGNIKSIDEFKTVVAYNLKNNEGEQLIIDSSEEQKERAMAAILIQRKCRGFLATQCKQPGGIVAALRDDGGNVVAYEVGPKYSSEGKKLYPWAVFPPKISTQEQKKEASKY